MGTTEDSALSAHMRATIGRIYDILSTLDADPLQPLLTDDVVMEFPYAPPGMADRLEGRDTVVSVMKGMPQMFTAFRISASAVYLSPASASAVVEAESQGSWRDGGAYANRYVTLFTFRDGKVALWREYFDPLRLGKA